jgi:acetyl-CoA acetyltransferase
MSRNPIQDTIAIAGVGTTGFSRAVGRSSLALALEASTRAIRDAGLTARDINGVVSLAEPGAPGPQQLVAALGIPEVTHFSSPAPVVMFSLLDAMNAIFSGACDTVLICSAMQRLPYASRSAANDPFKRSTGGRGLAVGIPEDIRMAAAYAAWASRYIHEYGATREPFGRVAINSRTGAVRNPLAAMRSPLTMQDYLDARMVREPLCMLDMDVPVDGADAFVLTGAGRARSLPQPRVLIHAATVGLVDTNDEDQASLQRHGQHVVARALRERSELWLDDVDVYFPYDGFTIITLGWFENIGWCRPGGASKFIAEHWDERASRLMLRGRIPVNPHGGSLSEGATRGTGHLREAVMQLRGQAGERQAPGAKTALITAGGFFFNSQGAFLRAG